MSTNKMISTWRERIGQPEDFPLHVPTDVERAMVDEIAELRASEGKAQISAELAWKWHDEAVAAGFACSEPAQELFAVLGWPDRAAAQQAITPAEDA